MGYSKRQFVEDAFDEIALAGYIFDISPDELQSQVRRLDRMMATWAGKGINLSYPLTTEPENSSLDTETDVPDSANEAIVCNLAIRIAPSFGKQVSIETKEAALLGYKTLLSRATIPIEMQFPGTMPAGAGNKPWTLNNDPFLTNPVNILDKELEWLTTST